MKKMTSIVLTFVAFGAAFNVQAAGDAAAGKAKSAMCASCHGANGISNNALWPNLAGQKDKYLIKQMKAFRDGARSDPMMSPMSKGLSDTDIENLAAFYSGL